MSGGCDEAERQILVERRGSEGGETRVIGEQRLDLGGKSEPARRLGIEQRLLAEVIASEEEAVGAAVPDGEREHAPQPGKKAGALVLVEVDEYFGVAPRAKPVSPREQIGPQRLVVVDLAVEDHHHGAVFIRRSAGARPRGR